MQEKKIHQNKEHKNNVMPMMFRASLPTLCVIFCLSSSGNNAFVPIKKLYKPYVVLADNKNKESEDDLKRRMELVRSIQSIYYKSENGNSSSLDETTGILHNLPLWRVQWTEVPGRSNILNVHEPTYTNMFEKILNRDRPWYFGHLYLPDGSKSLRSGNYCHQLKSWVDEVSDEERFKTRSRRSAIVGTLMRITDFRRLNDGRLCLLVQALERFVVQDAIQQLPYSIASVQILPDYESLNTNGMEFQSVRSRAKAVVDSFRYHPYEYQESELPVERGTDMKVTEVYGAWIANLLPFAFYSFDASTLPPSNVDKIDVDEDGIGSGSNDTLIGVELSLESRLLEGKILQSPPAHPEVSNSRRSLPLDELEQKLWDAMEDFCSSTRIELPPHLICLLPPGRLWRRLSCHRSLSPIYPRARRQQRLSFAAPALLEGTQVGRDLKQAWLETPSTHERMTSVLELFEVLNDQRIGRFE
jgi:Lon protease-like protein